MLSYETERYVFVLKEDSPDIQFRVWNNNSEDYDLIRIIEDESITPELLKTEIESFIDSEINLLRNIKNGLNKIGDN